MQWGTPESLRWADLARGTGYAWTMWPLFLRLVGAPLGGLGWFAVPGILLFATGFLGEWLARGEPSFRLNGRQTAAFIGATLVFWVAFALVVGVVGEAGESSCSVGGQQVEC